MAFLSDNDVIVHGDSERLRDLHDNARLFDISARRRRVSHRLRDGGEARIHHAAHRLWFWNSDRCNGGDELGRAAVWLSSPYRLDGSSDGRACMQGLGIDRRGASQHLAWPIQCRCRGGAPWAMYLRIVGPVYVCFGLGLGPFFVSQGFGRGFTAMVANLVRLLVSAGAGLAAVYWLDFGTTISSRPLPAASVLTPRRPRSRSVGFHPRQRLQLSEQE